MPLRLPARQTGFSTNFSGDGAGGPDSLIADLRGGGTETNGKPSLNVAEAAERLTRDNLSWSALGTPTTVSFAFRATASGMPSSVQGFTNFTTVQIQSTLLALQSWADVAGIIFVRQDDGSGYSDNATMLFGNYSSGQEGAAAFASLPGSTSASSTAGDVWVNSSLNYNAVPVQWGYGQLTLVHEIGHAIGLTHPAEYNAAAGVSITYAEHATYAEDSNQYTIMSYFRETATGAGYGSGRYASTPLLDDIAAAQRLYGANMSTRTGDTTYGFNSNADRSWFSASASAAAPIFAVWDAGGTDTLDFSGYGGAQLLDLRQGAFSNFGSLIGNVSIAIGAVIENAVGGSGDDTINGNSANNRITPGAGNNQVQGGLGSDTVVFSGPRSVYTITMSGQVGFISGPEGTTRFENVEFLAFSDMTIAAPQGSGGITVSGDMTDDTVEGASFDDTLSGGGGNDIIRGFDGHDRLMGGRGNDALEGGAGNDSFYVEQGNDSIAGGDGVDTLSAEGALSGVQINLQLGTIAGGGMGVDSVSGIERVTGSRFNDVIVGGAEDNYLQGYGGIDILRGGDGNDELVASWAEAGGGADVVKSGAQVNNTIAAAVSLDNAFDRLPREGVLSEMMPHATVLATTHGGLEYYAFTVGANTDVTFDIDGAAFDSTLRVYDAAGTELAANDDARYNGDGGSPTDSFLNFRFVAAGTYYVQVGRWGEGSGSGFTTVTPPAGLTYTLHVTVPGHAVQPTYAQGSQLHGDAGDDILRSSVGSDILDGGSGTDTVIFAGLRSSYTISVSGGVTTVSNADGSDTVTNVERLQFIDMVTNGVGGPITLPTIDGTADGDTLNGTDVAEAINGLDGNDVIHGMGGEDVVSGGAGNDYIDGGSGADQMSGGTGDDLYRVDNLNDVISEADGEGNDIAYATANLTLGQFVSVETLVAVGGAGPIALTGSSFSNTLIGNAHDNVMRGGAGDDLLIGDDGDDHLWGDAGNDALRGGRGSDVYVVDTGDVVIEAAGEGIDRVLASYSFALGAGQEVEFIEMINNSSMDRLDLWGNEFNNTLIGGAGTNILRGGGAGDNLYGLAGDDYLDGGDGADFMSGGTGNDTYYVNDSSDQFLEVAGEGSDRVATSVSWRLASGASIESLEVVNSTSTENINLWGNAFDQVIAGNFGANYLFGDDGNDVLAGYAGADTLDGGAGDDVLIGGLGADHMTGGNGSDKYYVDDTSDVVAETGAAGVDIVASSVSYRLAAGAQVEVLEPVTFSSTEALNFTGNEVANRIYGNAGNNLLNGGAGSDILEGLGGSDTFAFSDPLGPDNIDRINDFTVGADRFLLDNRIFVGLALGTLASGVFVTGATALDADDRILHDRATGALWFDADGTGAGAAIQFAVVAAGLDLSASDFIVGDGSISAPYGALAAPPAPAESAGATPAGQVDAPEPEGTVAIGDPDAMPPLDDATLDALLREDAFITLQDHGTLLPASADDTAGFTSFEDSATVFGGGADPLWMLTLLFEGDLPADVSRPGQPAWAPDHWPWD